MDLKTTLSKAVETYELQYCSFTWGQAVREMVRHGFEHVLPIELRGRILTEVEQDMNMRAVVEILDISVLDELATEYIDEFGADYE